MPKRVQRRRTRGWRMPENAVYVGRPTRWGNPFKVSVYGLEESLRFFGKYLEARLRVEPDFLEPLEGKTWRAGVPWIGLATPTFC